MPILALLLAGAQAAPAPVEAESLGRQVAASGTLATLLPLMAAKDVDALAADHPELGAADRAALRRTGAQVTDAAAARLFAAEGRAYAAALTVPELRAILAWQTGPTAARLRAAQPGAIAAAMGAMQGFDLKKEVWATFCAARAGGCPAK